MWTDDKWMAEINLVYEWLRTVEVSTRVRAMIERASKTGISHRHLRGQLISQLRVELSTIKGSPYHDGDETVGYSVDKVASATSSSLVALTARKVEFAAPIRDRYQRWLSDNVKQKRTQSPRAASVKPAPANDFGSVGELGFAIRGMTVAHGQSPAAQRAAEIAAARKKVQVPVPHARSVTAPPQTMIRPPTAPESPREDTGRQQSIVFDLSSEDSDGDAKVLQMTASSVGLTPKSALLLKKSSTPLVSSLAAEQEVTELVATTKLDRDRLKLLIAKYHAMIERKDLWGRINEHEFHALMVETIPEKDLRGRLFRAFKEEASGRLNFRAFLANLATLTNGSLDDILNFCFTIYDVDGDGEITRDELHAVLCSALQDEKEDDVMFVVMMAFNLYDKNHDERISLDEFQHMCHNDPILLKYIANHFKVEVGAHDIDVTDSEVLQGAAELQAAFEKLSAEERKPILEEIKLFRFDPVSTEDMGRFRLRDPSMYDAVTWFRKASAQRGVSLVCSRHSKTLESEVLEVRFDREYFTEMQAALWWVQHKHRFHREWFLADWEKLLREDPLAL
eukprot:TRINITY_DN13432_c0_g1_i1.p1 TRINITY_DN13432_c0_g1~~TRINITY_DN13432_c0_g1_i1.p1  ORF type:complete len:566 (-),score=97.87 TRINITY_DN13432_c0_g1_i1:57-1754(-)